MKMAIPLASLFTPFLHSAHSFFYCPSTLFSMKRTTTSSTSFAREARGVSYDDLDRLIEDSDSPLTISDPRLFQAAVAMPHGPYRDEALTARTALRNLQVLERRLHMTKTLYTSLSARQLCEEWGLFSEPEEERELYTLRVPKRRFDETVEHEACSKVISAVDDSLDRIRGWYSTLGSTVSRFRRYEDSELTTHTLFPNVFVGRLDSDAPYRPSQVKKKKVSFDSDPPSTEQGELYASDENDEGSASGPSSRGSVRSVDATSTNSGGQSMSALSATARSKLPAASK